MQLTQGLTRAATIAGDHIGLVFGDRRRTWREVESRVARAAAGFRSLALGRGDRIAVLAQSSDRYVETFLATPWAGGAIVPLNTRWALPEMVHALNDSSAKILCVDASQLENLPRLREECPTVKHVVYFGDDAAPEGLESYEGLISANEPAPDAMRGYEDMAGIFYTSGTTGKSKGVVLNHRNLFTNALAIIGYMQMGEHTHYLHSMPMFHVSGVIRVYSITLCAGRHVVAPKFEPAAVMQMIQDENITCSVFVPTMLNMMLHEPDFGQYDLSSLRDIAYGASPMPESLIRETMKKIPTARFTQAYGMTELSPVVTALLPEHHVVEGPNTKWLKSAGRPVIGAEIRIVDEKDNEVPTGTIGEITARGPMVMQGYWNLPELTAETVRDGWMHTGDAGYADEDGFLYLVDRIKDMIVTGGENVYSAEVESALYRHPAVKECAVVGIPNEKWVEAVHAIVVPKDGMTPTEDELIAHCRELIAGYKCPRSVEIRAEPLPLSGSNKILKAELRKPFWEKVEKG